MGTAKFCLAAALPLTLALALPAAAAGVTPVAGEEVWSDGGTQWLMTAGKPGTWKGRTPAPSTGSTKDAPAEFDSVEAIEQNGVVAARVTPTGAASPRCLYWGARKGAKVTGSYACAGGGGAWSITIAPPVTTKPGG
jgi:hypothetical protein